MNKQSIIGLVLIFGIFIGYMWWVSPSKEEIAAMRTRDSIAQVEAAQQALKEQAYNDSIAAVKAINDSLAATDTAFSQELRKADNRDRLGIFCASAEGDTANIVLRNKKMQVEISTLGAEVSKVILADYTTFNGGQLQLITPSDTNMNLVFSFERDHKMRTVNTDELVFVPYIGGKPVKAGDTLDVADGDSLMLSMRAYTEADSGAKAGYLEFLYTMRDNYEIGYNINFNGLGDITKRSYEWEFHWANAMRRQEKVDQSAKGSRNPNKDAERNYSNIYYKPVNDKVDNLRQGANDSKSLSGSINWIAYKQQFFSAILMSDTEITNPDMHVWTDKADTSSTHLCNMSSILSLTFDEATGKSGDMNFYFGPNKYRDLRSMKQGFERMLPLGWGFFLTQWISRFVIIPVFNLLEQFNWNYGIIIIILTILLKLVLFPLTFKSYQSSAIMRILKPEMDALNKKYPNQDQMMQKQQEMSKLQKRAGINPMAGCLPMLLQLPILWAMFRFYPASIELRQQPFLWADDLSTYDSILNLPFNIPMYGDHISLFCFLMFGMQFFYTWYTMKSQSSQASMPGMKFMMYFMPFMMLFMFNSLSAALNLYYLLSLTITMLQMILIRKFTSESKVRARMAAYDLKQQKGNGKKGNQKKSNFQKRLEALQKQAEEMQKQQQNQQRR